MQTSDNSRLALQYLYQYLCQLNDNKRKSAVNALSLLPQLLEALSNARVRKGVASDPNAPMETLQNAAEGNPNAPTGALQEPAKDEESGGGREA